MSLLSTIRESLFIHPGAYVKESRVFRYFPPSVKDYIEMYYLHVCPKNGLYELHELQTFMHNLLPLQASEYDNFHMIRPNGMKFGRMIFDEVVGYSLEQKWKTLEIVAEDVVVPDDFVATIYRTDTGVVTRDLRRRISIYVYPDYGYMHDGEGNLTFGNSALNIRPMSERPKSIRSADPLLDIAWIP